MHHEEDIFQAALALSPMQRPALLDVVCAGEPALRKRVEALLRAHDEAGFMQGGTAPDLDTKQAEV